MTTEQMSDTSLENNARMSSNFLQQQHTHRRVIADQMIFSHAQLGQCAEAAKALD